jgi:L-fuconolactonase
MVIDCHQHFWKFDPAIDTWITPDMSELRRDYAPSDLKPILEGNKIDGCVSVQSRQTTDDTKYLLNLAERNSFIKGVVGWVDLFSNDLEDQLSTFSSMQKLKGFRHIVQAEPAGFMINPIFVSAINKLKNFNFIYELLITSRQLAEAVAFVSRVDATPIVIDHIAKPNIAAKEFDTWKTQMKQLASFANIHCKLSGMVTETNWKKWTKEEFKPYIDVILECFGADRVMYGSDWPVCLVSASYEAQLEIINTHLIGLSLADRAGIMGLNAIKFYNLK